MGSWIKLNKSPLKTVKHRKLTVANGEDRYISISQKKTKIRRISQMEASVLIFANPSFITPKPLPGNGGFLFTKKGMFMQFDFFYEGEENTFDSYAIPRALLGSEFASLTARGMILYSELLRKMADKSLCRVDKQHRIYITYPMDDMAKFLNCSWRTTVTEFRRLEDFGLIHTERQGRGNPNRIYVNDFARVTRNPAAFRSEQFV